MCGNLYSLYIYTYSAIGLSLWRAIAMYITTLNSRQDGHENPASLQNLNDSAIWFLYSAGLGVKTYRVQVAEFAR
jgi:hypothetical protein